MCSGRTMKVSVLHENMAERNRFYLLIHDQFDHLRNPNYSYITTLEEVPKPCDTNAVRLLSWTMGYSCI